MSHQDYANRAAFIREGEIITVQMISKESSLGKLVKIDSQSLQTQDFPISFKVLDHNNQQWRLLYTGENKELLQFLSQPAIQDFTVQTPTLEDQFLSLYEGDDLK